VRYQTIGTSDLSVSVVGLGTNNFGGRTDFAGTRAVVDAAIDAGVTLFDTADIYGNSGGSETFLGELLEGRRDRVVLATKFGYEHATMPYPENLGRKGSRAYVRYALEQSLQRLRTDRVDLYQMHSPDASTPIEETLAALDELVGEGKVRYIGQSNFSGDQMRAAAKAAADNGWTAFVSAQNEYSLLQRSAEHEQLPAAVELGLGVLPYYPLARGLLTGKVTRADAIPAGTRLATQRDQVTDARLEVVQRLTGWAADHGRTVLDVAFGALLATAPIASVIAGATKPEQVRANVAAGDWLPTTDELAEIRALTDPEA
jgi:aryl-alcohol dehydrogenase-like predicted oxidoreductase